MLYAADLAAIVIVVVMTALVVIVVIGLHVWGAIQDGHEEKAMRAFRVDRSPDRVRGRPDAVFRRACPRREARSPLPDRAALGGGLPVRACERLAEIADVGCR